MVNDICTVSHWMTPYELEVFKGDKLESYIEHKLQQQMADFIVSETSDLIEKIENPPIFKLRLAILTPQRYTELLQKEYRLEQLEW